uniref:Amino acid transporter transmembrane domain-containing protein n=1 Tax=Chromera velia CCMP2878 TaxID=1169474 RepID=A0A0G4F1U4_9ALVE|mmetsp:Transcript_16344/g.33201  ORF Transcript_16344/g.33201 Transcript_16344/m.33201 type:complete len:499 (-) Transcript_16344:157-1653(-)|eukprot:Cvel_14642.t1-p1 / transcript=Cvel_14642.t1 / gene=Cvel_14642 / organism=Chromera_velia_CCMP2878 / gene_product=Vacuolar amino acid transporter 5, putative / transcript_product=Vacuolar amino acid transporter 5, putative / location=Cvel_scaffold1048:29553-34341(+) / protein_length=498 / sequence_SO=supercontig / SO=protein_coding / is_pseudo=false
MAAIDPEPGTRDLRVRLIADGGDGGDSPSRSSARGGTSDSERTRVSIAKESFIHEEAEEDVPVLPEDKAKGSTVPAAISVLAKTILGVGLLSLSSALKAVGIVYALLLLFLASCLSSFSLHLLGETALKEGGNQVTFYGVASNLFPPLRYVLDLVIAFKCIGVAISYLMVIASSVTDLLILAFPALGYPDLDEAARNRKIRALRAWALITCVVFLVAPTSLPKRIRSLRYTNYLALFGMLYFTAFVIIYYFSVLASGGETRGSEVVFFRNDPFEMLRVLPIFIFSFTCHQNMFTICNELRNRSIGKVNTVIVGSVAASLCVYIGPAVCGYLQFGNATTDNLLRNYDSSATEGNGVAKVAVLTCKVLMAVAFIFTYPLQCHPARTSLRVVIWRDAELSRQQERWILRGLTVAILVVTTAIACLVENMQFILAVVGAVGSNSICYIMPAMIYIKMFESDGWTVKRILSVVLLAIGVVIMPLCLYAEISEVFKKNNLENHE